MSRPPTSPHTDADTDATADAGPPADPGAGHDRAARQHGPVADVTSAVQQAPADASPHTTRRPPEWLPDSLAGTAAWSAAALIVGLVAYLVLQFAITVWVLVVAFFLGLLLTALLRPVAGLLVRIGLPRLLSAWVVLLGTIVLFLGAAWILQRRLRSELPTLGAELTEALGRVRDYLVQTVGLSSAQVDQLFDAAINRVRQTTGSATSGMGSAVLTGATTLLTVLTGLALALFTAFWLVYDGGRVWRFLVSLLPTAWQGRADHAGGAAWETLGGYLRGLTLVALMDAVGIGIALVLLGVPIPFTLAALTFFGAYIPIVGAFLAGLAAVLVAFAAQGLTTALLTLGAVILVQQLEGNVLQPIIMAHAVRLHPLAIAWAIAIGALLYGIVGALLSVPLLAVLYAVGTALARPGPSSSRRDA